MRGKERHPMDNCSMLASVETNEEMRECEREEKGECNLDSQWLILLSCTKEEAYKYRCVPIEFREY